MRLHAMNIRTNYNSLNKNNSFIMELLFKTQNNTKSGIIMNFDCANSIEMVQSVNVYSNSKRFCDAF